MKKYLFIFLVLFLCAFLFTSCEELGDLLGELLGGGEDGEEETYDYRNGGGGSTATLTGTWKGTSQVAGESFGDLIDCDLTVTIDAEGNISINEVVKSTQEVKNSVTGTYTLEDSMIRILKASPKTGDPQFPWVRIPVPAGDTVKLLDVEDKEYFSDPEFDNAGLVYNVQGNVLTYSSADNLFGSITVTGYTFDFGETSYSALKKDDTFTRRVLRAEQVEYDENEIVTIEEKDKLVTETVASVETGETAIVFNFSEAAVVYDKLSIWYKYEAETDTLVVCWGLDPVTLTKQQ